MKTTYLNNGKTHYSPYGFHLNEDLISFCQIADNLKRNQISKQARLRLKWFDYYLQTNNASLICRYFGISRKTFYYWKKRYDPFNLKTLESQSKAPIRIRRPEISWFQEQRIINLRKKYIRYSKINYLLFTKESTINKYRPGKYRE